MTDEPTKKQDNTTLYVEGEIDSGQMAVGLWNLHVRITNDADYWFAQGYEIDYAAEGSSLEDVKTRFQCGLSATIHEHLKIHGTAEKLLTPAPQEAWQALRDAPGSRHTYSQQGIYTFMDPSIMDSLPYPAIEYFTTGRNVSAALHA